MLGWQVVGKLGVCCGEDWKRAGGAAAERPLPTKWVDCVGCRRGKVGFLGGLWPLVVLFV